MNEVSRTSKEKTIAEIISVMESARDYGEGTCQDLVQIHVGHICSTIELLKQLQSAHEPFSAPPTAEHLANFSDWLNIEMPAGTIIGNQNWWARKLLNAAYVTTPERPAPPPVPDLSTVRLLGELDEYLSRSPAEAIHATSIWHQQIKSELRRLRITKEGGQ